jgi:hypothetical protein
LIKDGSQIKFWEDSWLGNAPLREQYPALYNIVRYKSDTIAKVMATSPPDVTFRRDLLGPRLVAWNAFLQHLATIHLSTQPDKFHWNLHKNGEFSVDSMYNALIHQNIPIDDNKMIWKMKIPLKTKVFGGTFIVELFSPKTIWLNGTGTETRFVFFVITMRLLNTCFFNAGSQDLYGQSSK